MGYRKDHLETIMLDFPVVRHFSSLKMEYKTAALEAAKLSGLKIEWSDSSMPHLPPLAGYGSVFTTEPVDADLHKFWRLFEAIRDGKDLPV